MSQKGTSPTSRQRCGRPGANPGGSALVFFRNIEHYPGCVANSTLAFGRALPRGSSFHGATRQNVSADTSRHARRRLGGLKRITFLLPRRVGAADAIFCVDPGTLSSITPPSAPSPFPRRWLPCTSPQDSQLRNIFSHRFFNLQESAAMHTVHRRRRGVSHRGEHRNMVVEPTSPTNNDETLFETHRGTDNELRGITCWPLGDL